MKEKIITIKPKGITQKALINIRKDHISPTTDRGENNS